MPDDETTASINPATPLNNDSTDFTSTLTPAPSIEPQEELERVRSPKEAVLAASVQDSVTRDEFSSLNLPPTPESLASLPSGIIEPIPNPPSNSNSILNAVPSRTPTPTLLTKIDPPSASSSPIPVKKFASSLSVNKKFLEKAGEKGKVEVKVVVAARLATPPIPPPVSTSHPRLLTGKLSSAPALSLSTAQASAGISGWNKTTPIPEGTARPSVPIQSVAYNVRGNSSAVRGRTGSFGSGGRGAVWASSRGGMDLGPGGIASDFPTAAEAANEKVLRAAALLEQMQARDRAIQARAAAAAAANAHLLEGLDAFRGVHLDPNAHHWDEMGDEEDDFLDETIEFGDGTQYKIDIDGPTAIVELEIVEEFLSEPDPSDFATLEAPLEEGEEVVGEPTSREERFKDDYDRTWVNKPAPEAKNLFNDRLGKLEPYASTSTRGQSGLILGRGPPPQESRPAVPVESRSASTRKASIDIPPHLSQHPHPPTQDSRRESVSSSRSDKTRKEEPRVAWAIPREPSRQSADSGTGRQLPPHLTAPIVAAPPPPPPPPVVVAPVVVEPPKVVDIEELHAREMHAAVERAKIRKQDEELTRSAGAERAQKKAAEMEEKMKPVIIAPPSPVSEPAPILSTSIPTERVNSWRKPPTIPVPTEAAIIIKAPLPVKAEPIKILAREPVVPAAPLVSPPPVVTVRTPIVPHSSISKTISSNLPPASNNVKSIPPHLIGRAPPSALATPPTLPVQPEREWRREGLVDRRQAPTQSIPPTSNSAATPTPLPVIPTPSPSVTRALAPIVAKVAKPADTSAIDDLMSRVKGAMLPPKSILQQPARIQDPSQTILVQRVEIERIATVRLPLLPVAIILAEVVTKEFVGKGKGKKVPIPARKEITIGLFDVTVPERPMSPPPAWKAYLVGLPTYSPLSTPSAKALKGFLNPKSPTKVVVLSPSRKPNGDDFLFAKKSTERKVNHVVLPRKRLVKRTVEEERLLAVSKRVVRTVAAVETRSIETSEILFAEDSKPTPRSRLPSAGGFVQDFEVAEEVEDERKFMVGGLNGEEVVKVGTRENLAAPGDRVATISLPIPSKAAPVFDNSTTTATSVNWPAPAPLSLLDQSIPSVWSAPPVDAPVHTRSISLSGLQVGNSLQGIADDDPSATIPSSLADLKSEDGGSDVNSIKMDDSRIRSMPPRFAPPESMNSMEGTGPQHFNSQNLPNRYPPPPPQQQFHRPPPPPSNLQYQIPSPYGYSAPIPPSPLYSQHQQFSPYQSPYPTYSPSPFTLPPQPQLQPGSPFNNYRPIPMPYGGVQFGPVGGNFGAVGGSPHASQQPRPQFHHPRSPIVQHNSYSTNHFQGFNSPMGREGGNGQNGNGGYGMASPVMLPNHLQGPSSLFGDMNMNGRGGMNLPGGPGQGQGPYRRPY